MSDEVNFDYVDENLLSESISKMDNTAKSEVLIKDDLREEAENNFN